MKKLSILLSTINDRIFDAARLLELRFDNSEFVVVHQITDLSKSDTYSNFYNKYANTDIRFIPMYAKGTGKSRNAAMANAQGELMYLCDDDLNLLPDFYSTIIQTADNYPEIDIFSFKIRTTEQQPFKQYPAEAYNHTIRSTAKVSIVEMVIRKSAYDAVKFILMNDLGWLLPTIPVKNLLCSLMPCGKVPAQGLFRNTLLNIRP